LPLQPVRGDRFEDQRDDEQHISRDCHEAGEIEGSSAGWLIHGAEQGWPAWTILSLFGSALAFVLFGWVERRVDRRGGSPLIAERVLRAPGFGFAMVAVVLALAALGGFLFTFTQHLQLGLRDSPLQAGLTFVPMALGFALASLNWRRLPVAWHQVVIPAGCIIAVVGYSLTAIAASSGGDGGFLLPIALFVAGFGQGMAASPILTVALSKVAPQDAADASGVITTVIQLGLVLGVATFGSVFLNQAALPGAQPTVTAITLTLALIVIALLGCAVASTTMVRAQRSAAVAFGDVVQDAGRTA